MTICCTLSQMRPFCWEHRNPKRKRGNNLRPRLRFGLQSVPAACGVVLFLSTVVALAAPSALAKEDARPVSSQAAVGNKETFTVTDTVKFVPGKTDRERAELKKMMWVPGSFQVQSEASADDSCDRVLKFPSAMPSKISKTFDTVVVHCHWARKPGGTERLKGPQPAVLVFSPIAPDMLEVADGMADDLADGGVNAFAMALPGNGPRSAAGGGGGNAAALATIAANPAAFVEGVKHGSQAAADVRRTRDVIAQLPGVGPAIGIEGFCLGGLAALPAQSIDNPFSVMVIAFSGGDLHAFFASPTGQMYLLGFQMAGMNQAEIAAMMTDDEPTRLACRIDASRVHLFSFSHDGLWPKDCDRALVKALKITEKQHTVFEGTHAGMGSKLAAVNKKMVEMLKARTNRKRYEK